MQNLKVALFLAFKSITKGQRSTIALMIFLLSLSFVNLVFFASILNGFGEATQKQITNNMTSNIVVDPQDEQKEAFIANAKEVQRKIERVPGVVATTGRYKLAGTISYEKEKSAEPVIVSSQIAGIDPEKEKNVIDIHKYMVQGEYLEGLGDDGIVLGANLAGGYGESGEFTSLGGVKAGEKVRVTFSNGITRAYTVKGIFKVKFGFVDRLAFVSSSEAESILSLQNNASQILVKTDQDRGTEDEVVKTVQAAVPDLKVRKWTEVMGDFANITKTLDTVVLIVNAIALAVAAITIFILIYINAINKRRQIGILKAIGIRQDIVIKSYIIQALFFALSGIAIGTVLILYVVAPYFVSHPLKLPLGDVGLALDTRLMTYSALGLFAAGLVGGFIPSWQVARQNILKAIWGA